MFPEMRPAALAMPTITPVKTTLLFSEMELLEYQVDSMTEGVLDPIHKRKQALIGGQVSMESRAIIMGRRCCCGSV